MKFPNLNIIFGKAKIMLEIFLTFICWCTCTVDAKIVCPVIMKSTENNLTGFSLLTQRRSGWSLSTCHMQGDVRKRHRETETELFIRMLFVCSPNSLCYRWLNWEWMKSSCHLGLFLKYTPRKHTIKANKINLLILVFPSRGLVRVAVQLLLHNQSW